MTLSAQHHHRSAHILHPFRSRCDGVSFQRMARGATGFLSLATNTMPIPEPDPGIIFFDRASNAPSRVYVSARVHPWRCFSGASTPSAYLFKKGMGLILPAPQGDQGSPCLVGGFIVGAWSRMRGGLSGQSRVRWRHPSTEHPLPRASSTTKIWKLGKLSQRSHPTRGD